MDLTEEFEDKNLKTSFKQTILHPGGFFCILHILVKKIIFDFEYYLKKKLKRKIYILAENMWI